MALDVIHSVFLSSTFEDLRNERAEVQKAILKLRCMPIGMELFPSSDEEAWGYIKRQIQACDYYVLIIAGRYGSVTPDGMSFTEKEYLFAKEANKPSLAFIRQNRQQLPSEMTDRDSGKSQRLERFVQRVQSNSLVSFFESPHELATQFVTSFVALRDKRPAVGFVRADQVADPVKYSAALEANARLQAENNKLSEQLRIIAKQSNEPFEGHQSEITLNCFSTGDNVKTDNVLRVTVKFYKVFLVVAQAIAKDLDETKLSKFLAGNVEWPSSSILDRTRLYCKAESLRIVREKFIQLGLISVHHSSKTGDYDAVISVNHWSLTEAGHRQSAVLSRIYPVE